MAANCHLEFSKFKFVVPGSVWVWSVNMHHLDQISLKSVKGF